eukprot:gb/GFBE01031063.1/.p1 GENE.gb/GFBE01031063.1/~~gb/GFBE01031063.1/.p1  ORF type:complete len:419 (+),score=98.00 gb/GFBE01031063.1/:1-1257(+)
MATSAAEEKEPQEGTAGSSSATESATPSSAASPVTAADASSSLDVAKSDAVLRPIQALPGIVTKTFGNLVGGATLGAGWAVGKADAKLGKAKQVSDSEAFKMGFRVWLHANGVWPTVLCESGPYGNDFNPLPQDPAARSKMLRSTSLIVSNHVSYLDTVVLPMVLDVPKLMAMAEVQSWPLFGQLCQEMDMIWVDRSSPESRKAAREAIVNHASEWKDGERPLLLWPEGTTSNGQGIKEFKSGAFTPGVPIRPVVIKYTGDWDPANVNFREETTPKASGGYPASEDSPTSATSAAEKYGDKEWVEQFLGHMVHSCTVLVCKPYYPSAEEKADPELFKANVHKLMHERLQELTLMEDRRRKTKDTRRSVSDATNDFLGSVDKFLGAAGRKFSETSEQVQTSMPWLQKLWQDGRQPKGSA